MTIPVRAAAGRRMRRTGLGWLAAIGRAIHLSRQRRALHDLDDYLLNDIGLSRPAARREADRPFWDAPAHWRD